MDILTETQLEALRAVMNRIIPPGDGPGAVEAGAADYLTRQLHGDLNHVLPAYRSGLDSLDREADLTYGSRFAELSTARQDSLLFAVELDQVHASWEESASRFFNMLLHHTAEGYYSNPGNGGNRDEVSWKMIGFR